MDFTKVHSSCEHIAHRIDLHLWRGAPINLDESRPIEILINDGYVVGFCPERLQPVWSAYRVAHADQQVDYDRPIAYYDDLRLSKEHRIGSKTFGKIADTRLNVGHMTPNEVINQQFGRLAQLETFLMSNMSPQYGSLNQGVWLKLENSIRKIKDEDGKDHVWVIVGPIFSENPPSISRGRGKNLPIPESYYCVTVDPYAYPYNTLSKVHLDCFIIPQNAPRTSNPNDYPATLDEIEEATNLKFFKSWGREYDVTHLNQNLDINNAPSRLQQILLELEEEEKNISQIEEKPENIEDIVSILKKQAEEINNKTTKLDVDDKRQLLTLQHTISWMLKAQELTQDTPQETQEATIITYKIENDIEDKLKIAARTACNFWNRFVQPKNSIVIILGLFTQNSYSIARAYEPALSAGIMYGKVEFNTKYLVDFSSEEIAGTIIHEIGHSLGIGWEKWMKLFHKESGKFKSNAISKLHDLGLMIVETDGGRGTAYSHWDEDQFGSELMTGYQNSGEYVLPVTIDIMGLLGHKVIEKINEPTNLSELIQDSEGMIFSRQREIEKIDLDYLLDTKIFEEIPHKIKDKS